MRSICGVDYDGCAAGDQYVDSRAAATKEILAAFRAT